MAEPLTSEDIATAVAKAVAAVLAEKETTGPEAPQVVQFALTPTLAQQGTFNYASEAGAIAYKEATKSLYNKKDEPFGVEEEGLLTFLNRLGDRAREQGWTSDADPPNALLNVPTTITEAGPQGPYHNLITSYGEVSPERIKNYEVHIDMTNDRKKQQLFQLYKCLMSSLSIQGDAMIKVWKDEFIHDGASNITGGLSLLKVIVRESALDANASTETLRRRLTELDAYTTNVKYDILKVNAQAKLIVEGLAARGQTTTELTTNLFRAYETVPVAGFNWYIKNKRDTHDEGTKPMNPNTLMKMAGDKYKVLMERGEWVVSPQVDESRIVAVEAKFSKQLSKLNKLVKKRPKQVTFDHDEKPPGDVNNKKHWAKPDWLKKNTKPKADEINKPRKWGKYEYHWCGSESGGKCDGKWRRHKPSECKGMKRKNDDNSNTTSNKKKPIVDAYAAVQDAYREEE